MTGHTPAEVPVAQMRLIAALGEGRCYPHPAGSVRLIETHISWVLLAGSHAYKIKKALNLGFLDFTTLPQRKFFCEEEVRLNRRTAPQIYLGVVPIGGTPDNPVLGAEPAIEYAVRMNRFSLAAEMDNLIEAGKVLPSHADSLAQVLAQFHAELPPVAPDSPYGSSFAIRDLALENFSGLPESLFDIVGRFVVDALLHATDDEFVACEPLIEARRKQGFVRECHGDLHLGNIVIQAGKAIPFDGIEFDPALRWTDIICDIAFPFMDMLHYRRPDLAFRFLNAWLEITGDYAGVALLRFYSSYRAGVRAKVNAIRAAQPSTPPAIKAQALDAYRTYLSKAANCLSRNRPALIITHGLPGSGKTSFSQMALERFGAIRIRSDVERKRLFGLAALDRSGSAIGSNLYDEDATARTYQSLYDLAEHLLRAGQRVIVDAAFLKPEERDRFRQLARKVAARFVIASVQADDAVLRERVEQRMRQRKDASEADLRVLEAMQAVNRPLEVSELANSITFFNEGTSGFSADDPGWVELEKQMK